MACGGSLKNAVVLDENGVINDEGLRYADEFVRHKILDCVGDLALAGVPIFAELIARKPGHRLNHALLRELFAHRDRWKWMSYRDMVERSHAGLEIESSPVMAAASEQRGAGDG